LPFKWQPAEHVCIAFELKFDCETMHIERERVKKRKTFHLSPFVFVFVLVAFHEAITKCKEQRPYFPSPCFTSNDRTSAIPDREHCRVLLFPPTLHLIKFTYPYPSKLHHHRIVYISFSPLCGQLSIIPRHKLHKQLKE